MNVRGFINKRFDTDDSFRPLAKDEVIFSQATLMKNHLSDVVSESCCPDEAGASTRPGAEFGLFKALPKYQLISLRHYQQRCFAQMNSDGFCEASVGAFAPLSVHSLPSLGVSTAPKEPPANLHLLDDSKRCSPH